MASSRPQLIQFPIQCQLCKKDPKISWKCLECDLLMCNICKNNIHSEIKTAKEHRILSIKDIGEKSTPRKKSSKTDITVVAEYQTKLKGVFQLAISLDDSLWIGEGIHKNRTRLLTSHTGLQKVKCKGNKLTVISSFNIDIYSMAITASNDLLIATDGPLLKQIKCGTNKVTDSIYDLKSYLPLSIHVSRKNKVIAGAWNEDENLVIVMDHKGSQERIYRGDQTNSISFTYPWKINSTNNHIFVIDHKEYECEGQVVMCDNDDIINTYSGHSAINNEFRPFIPIDITTTPTDNVIVVDMYSSTLHILNFSGQLMRCISTEDKGIAHPYSIRLAREGLLYMLYIGTTTIDERTDKAILYKLKLIGCK